MGAGCGKCSTITMGEKTRRKGAEQFIDKANIVHNNHYDYNKVEYIHSKTDVIIICPEHGEFPQLPNMHLNGYGCVKCANAGIKHKVTKQFSKNRQRQGQKDRTSAQHDKVGSEKCAMEFSDKASKLHNNFYDYSEVKYINSKIDITILCPTHGPYEQSPNLHLSGRGCFYCGIEKKRQKAYERCVGKFISEATEVHGTKYDYYM
jgi:hypothetical protein